MTDSAPEEQKSLADKAADFVANMVGSWTFILVQLGFIVAWIIANLTGILMRWDPYPFILLNLMMSFQAAFTAPIIMMSQNRQNDIDRERAKKDLEVNIKAEQEIEDIQAKLDEILKKLDDKK